MDSHRSIQRSNRLIQSFAAVLAMFFVLTTGVAAQETPDALVKRVSQDVLDTAKADKGIQSGNHGRIVELVESKIFPYVDFQKTTAMTAGRYWSQATPEQQKKLADEFRRLLVNTYAGAISKVRNQQIKFKPFRGSPSDAEAVVRSEVQQPNGDPIELDYRLAKTSSGWKIYDLNIFGAWLIETYKQTFSSEISKSGVDGLIKTLSEKNNKLAKGASDDKAEKSSQK